MTSFSATCPQVSPQELQAEFESFSEEECMEVFGDLYGGNETVPEVSQKVLENGVRLIRSALAGIPVPDKLAYLEALDRAPHLVEEESHPALYLRKDDFDPWMAAERLVDYWKMRKSVFGGTRAFLPMTLDGAMADDVTILDQTPIHVLPCDKHGRVVVFWDRIKQAQIPGATRAVLLHNFFYVFHRISQTAEAQANGVVVVFNLKNFDVYTHFDRKLMKNMSAICSSSGVRIRAVHMCTGQGEGVIHYLLPVLLAFLPNHVRHRTVLHSGTDEENLESLEEYGLHRTCLSSRIGGNVLPEEFRNWIAHQSFLEFRY